MLPAVHWYLLLTLIPAASSLLRDERHSVRRLSALGFGQAGKIPTIFNSDHHIKVRWTSADMPSSTWHKIVDLHNPLVQRAAMSAVTLRNTQHAAAPLSRCHLAGGTQHPGMGVTYRLALRCKASAHATHTTPYDATVSWRSWATPPYVLHSFAKSNLIPTAPPTRAPRLGGRTVYLGADARNDARSCAQSTGATCHLFKCAKWRNAHCDKRGHCVCGQGYCAVEIQERKSKMCMVANVLQDSTAALAQHKVPGIATTASIDVRAKLLAKAQELRKQMDTISAGARASTSATKAPVGLVNVWGDKSCTAWVTSDPKRCSAPNYKQNCAKVCATVATAATVASSALKNVWGDASCATWVSQDAKRCGAPNYQQNCAKECAKTAH